LERTDIVCSTCDGIVTCPTCDGMGSLPRGVTCPTCDGEGSLPRGDRSDALRPTCPTCDGKGIIDRSLAPHATPSHVECPDCVDGRMSWEWVAAIATAVFDRLPYHYEDTIAYLQSVRP